MLRKTCSIPPTPSRRETVSGPLPLRRAVRWENWNGWITKADSRSSTPATYSGCRRSRRNKQKHIVEDGDKGTGLLSPLPEHLCDLVRIRGIRYESLMYLCKIGPYYSCHRQISTRLPLLLFRSVPSSPSILQVTIQFSICRFDLKLLYHNRMTNLTFLRPAASVSLKYLRVTCSASYNVLWIFEI